LIFYFIFLFSGQATFVPNKERSNQAAEEIQTTLFTSWLSGTAAAMDPLSMEETDPYDLPLLKEPRTVPLPVQPTLPIN
jgi:hypothetical protein